MNYLFTRPFRFLSPSQVTLIGLALAIIGIALITTASTTTMLWVAIVILIASFLTDRLDGQLSRYFKALMEAKHEHPVTPEMEKKMGLWSRISYKGPTVLGKSLDPLVDKIRFVGLMWTVGSNEIWLVIKITITLLAIALTGIRHINLTMGYDDGSSKNSGKLKVVIEVIAIAMLVFMTEPVTGVPNPLAGSWATEGALNALFAFAMAGGVSSLRGHLLKYLNGKEAARQAELRRRFRN
jgi:phosphatidylglycerophosphate synthase